MIRLGLRLATAGGRGAVASLALSATAVAIGSAVLLFALSFAPAVAERDARTAWREHLQPTTEARAATLVLPVEDRVGDQLLTRVLVGPTRSPDAAPVPPGIPALPGPGEAYVSPALAALLQTVPAEQLGDRIGRVVGTVADASLASPDELVAIIGVDGDDLRAQDAMPVLGFSDEPLPLDLPPVGVLILVLAAVGALAPVAVFVSTATRLSAARRDLRLAALRLVGATPVQVARLAVVEALVVTALGAVAGVVLFLALRPLVARIPLDATTWWPSSIAPPLPAAIAMLLAVQVVGAAGALVTMRRLVVTPLGVQRRAVPPAPGASRLVPLAVSLAALLVAVALYRNRDIPDAVQLALPGGAFAAVIGAIAFAGPWLTAAVGSLLHRSARGASTLLAARRLSDEPRGSFGAIAGVIMAVFVASAFFTFTAFTRAQAGVDVDPLLRRDGLHAFVRGGTSMPPDIAARIGRVDGVTGVVPIRPVAIVDGESIVDYGWVAPCAELVVVLPVEATCSPGGVESPSGYALAGRYRLIPDTADADGGVPASVGVEIEGGGSVPPFAVDGEVSSYLPAYLFDPAALDDPAAAERLPIGRVYVTTDGSPGVGERVRTAVIAAAPNAFVRLETERLAENTQFEEIGRVVGLGLIGTLALAGCSLAVAVTTATLERRRQFVFLRSAGMSTGALRATILLQAGAPLAAVAIASAALGAFVGSTVLWIVNGSAAVPDASLVGVIALSLAVAMGVVALTLPPLERMTRPASLRHE